MRGRHRLVSVSRSSPAPISNELNSDGERTETRNEQRAKPPSPLMRSPYDHLHLSVRPQRRACSCDLHCNHGQTTAVTRNRWDQRGAPRISARHTRGRQNFQTSELRSKFQVPGEFWSFRKSFFDGKKWSKLQRIGNIRLCITRSTDNGKTNFYNDWLETDDRRIPRKIDQSSRWGPPFYTVYLVSVSPNNKRVTQHFKF